MVNKNAYEIRKGPKHSQQNNLETVTNEYNKEIPRERCVSPERKTRNYWWTEILIGQ